MMHKIPYVKDIMLVGGGHSHALVIRMFAMNPVAGLRLTLVSPNVYTPYSGMLPGLIAGHYTFEETHIDLSRLCAWAGVRFLQAEAKGLDCAENLLHLKNRPSIGFDICSLGIGSTPSYEIRGSKEFSVGIKPIDEFLNHWTELQNTLLKYKNKEAFKIAIIGGGHGGVEVTLSMQYWAKKNNVNAEFHIFHRGSKLLEGSPIFQQKQLFKRLKKENIQVYLDFNCDKMTKTHLFSSKESFNYDKIFTCTHASPEPWLKDTDLELNERGFINIKDTLQSSNHDHVFAAGDICHQKNNPRPKAGVYAVRMGPILYKNILGIALDKPLIKFKPQKDFLSLSALGGKYAMARRKPFFFSGKWVWKLKNHIDKKFMRMLQELHPMDNELHQKLELDPHLQKVLGIKDIKELAMRCGGCGGKVGASVLSEVLGGLNIYKHPDILLGLDNADDAAVLKTPKDQLLVQTIDFLKMIIDDPYLFGKLSALHALSDVFAMNAIPHSAQAMVQLPLLREALQVRDMKQLMQGAVEVLNEHGCSLVGGHTTEDVHLNLGFTINAFAEDENKLLTKQNLKNNQVLILTKPLGTGSLFAAHMQAKAKGVYIHEALRFMLQSNKRASEIFRDHHVSSCTDITGFGLLGHLAEMIKGTEFGFEILIDKVPALLGAIEVMNAGIFSSLQPQNIRLRRVLENQKEFIHHEKYPLLFDPQTCGGLVGAVDANCVDDCIATLKKAGYKESIVVGRVSAEMQKGLIKLS